MSNDQIVSLGMMAVAIALPLIIGKIDVRRIRGKYDDRVQQDRAESKIYTEAFDFVILLGCLVLIALYGKVPANQRDYGVLLFAVIMIGRRIYEVTERKRND